MKRYSLALFKSIFEYATTIFAKVDNSDGSSLLTKDWKQTCK